MAFEPSCLPDDFATLSGKLADTEATHEFGIVLGRHLKKGDCLGLVGEMGAGKTTLCRGLAQGFGVVDLDDVTSPTYALVNIYDTAHAPLVHMDAWRLGDGAKAAALGLEEEVVRDDALVVVEWADLLASAMPASSLWLHLRQAALGRTYSLWGPKAWLHQLELKR